jgi:hypothetical protein
VHARHDRSLIHQRHSRRPCAGQSIVLLINSLRDDGDSAIADPLANVRPSTSGMTHKYRNRRFERVISETNFRDTSTSGEGMGLCDLPDVSDVVYFETHRRSYLERSIFESRRP